MIYRLLTVFVLCAVLSSPVFADEKKKPTPEELLNPTPVTAPVADCKGYDDILKVEPANLAALNGRGLCLNVINPGEGDADLAKAAELATALINADDKNADAYYSRATTYRVMQDYKKARADYARAVELKPDNAFWKADLETLTREVELRAQFEEQVNKNAEPEGRAEAALRP